MVLPQKSEPQWVKLAVGTQRVQQHVVLSSVLVHPTTHGAFQFKADRFQQSVTGTVPLHDVGLNSLHRQVVKGIRAHRGDHLGADAFTPTVPSHIKPDGDVTVIPVPIMQADRGNDSRFSALSTPHRIARRVA